MFRIGQKVVCLTSNWPNIAFEQYPRKGGIYTIRSFMNLGGNKGRIFALRLSEIINEPALYQDGFLECGFAIYGFRPLVTKKTDISIFKQMLEPVRENA